ncbi:hypothetical protein [Methylobacterium gnaphalii]|uniref:hypothetical protein n=1 Tax=Methylobacterium gnaphalii TaxID=1010610 RepID=UPI0011BF814E|nr:hypothetical protein [Methylobacterium gnaphalii]GJD70886.1 hypothetical protein MMMDOFMJ_3840 [Methylobacterium gnaphalii]
MSSKEPGQYGTLIASLIAGGAVLTGLFLFFAWIDSSITDLIFPGARVTVTTSQSVRNLEFYSRQHLKDSPDDASERARLKCWKIKLEKAFVIQERGTNAAIKDNPGNSHYVTLATAVNLSTEDVRAAAIDPSFHDGEERMLIKLSNNLAIGYDPTHQDICEEDNKGWSEEYSCAKKCSGSPDQIKSCLSTNGCGILTNYKRWQFYLVIPISKYKDRNLYCKATRAFLGKKLHILTRYT